MATSGTPVYNIFDKTTIYSISMKIKVAIELNRNQAIMVLTGTLTLKK